MRARRIKIASEEGEAVYHCVTRTVNGEKLFTDVDREQLRREIWRVAAYCGVHVLTYAILSNHFHLLVRVPQKRPLSDHELLRRFEIMYPTPTKYQTARLQVIKAQLSSQAPEAVAWRERQQQLMGDLSSYLKLLKQRFSIFFNRRHERFGTLWAERFKSVLLEPGRAIRVVAAYIDLNAVRAGLVNDPKDYRFCGYAEAVAGSRLAREGLSHVMECPWRQAAASYRLLVFGRAAQPSPTSRGVDGRVFQEVLQRRGKLSLAQVLRCRVRHFTDSGILGSRLFVENSLRQCSISRVHPLHGSSIPHIRGLHALRQLRNRAGALVGEGRALRASPPGMGQAAYVPD